MKSVNHTVPVEQSTVTPRSGSPNVNTTLSQVAGSGVRFPWRLLAGVLILTVSLGAGLVWNALRADRLNVATQQHCPVLGSLAGLGLTLWIWGVVIHHLRRWRRTLVQAMEDRAQTVVALRHSQEQLEVRVRQRTAALSTEMAERKQAEEARQEKEEQFQTICAAAHDAIIIMDNDGRFSFWNQAAEGIFGLSQPEALGKNLHDLLTPAVYREKLQPALARWSETGQGAALGKTLELIARRKNGAEFPIELSLSALTVKGRWHAIGIVRDITERKRMEAEVAKARDVAVEATRLKAEFLANMSHEIRTPMSGIIGMVNLLLDTELSAPQRHFANTIGHSGESLLALINDILDFSKIEARKLVLETLDFDLQEVLENTLDLLTERAQSKKIELAAFVPATVPTRLRGDPSRLRQILLNLVANALKFTEHGEVIVRLAKQSETPTHVTLRLEVKDTGMGITPAGQQRLFQAFSQADESTQRQYGGTGLGLAICKQLVELMGGHIGVESEPGKGATFWFTTVWEKQPVVAVPVRKDKPELADLRVLIVDNNVTLLPSTRAAASVRPLRILLAEDDVINQQVALRQLRKLGWTAHVVANGRAVLTALEQVSYDVILMDCQMPGMGGLETTQEIRRREGQQGGCPVHIIAMTARVMPGDREECLAAGMNDYISKPVRLVDLQKALDRCVRDESANGQAAAGLLPRSDAEPVISPNLVAVGDAPPPTVGAEESPVDWKRFQEIAEDSPQGARQLTELYLAQADHLMNGIQAAIKADAAKDLCQLAHKLGGSSSACGIRAILPPLLELEGQGRRGRLSDADQLFAQTSRKLESIRRVLSDQLSGLPGEL